MLHFFIARIRSGNYKTEEGDQVLNSFTFGRISIKNNRPDGKKNPLQVRQAQNSQNKEFVRRFFRNINPFKLPHCLPAGRGEPIGDYERGQKALQDAMYELLKMQPDFEQKWT
jgi:hypothetical protein